MLASGHSKVETHAESDVLIVRGCSVTARAQHDCERLIAHLREKYPAKRLVVLGCLPKAQHTPEELLNGLLADSEQSAAAVPQRTARAYLKVQDGCNGRCTFCIVPTFRGKSVSIPFAEVMERARRFIDAGYHEIVVTGCNLSLYASEGKRLPELMDALCELGAADSEKRCRVRLGSIEPGECAMSILDVMEKHENFCRFLHLPIQSMSHRMLIAMGRPYRPVDVTNLLNEVEHRFPLLGLGADLMTGFPGECDLDHAATLRLIKSHPFSNLHVFPYSERPGTMATKLPGVVPAQIRSRRAHELAELGDCQRAEFAKSFVGHEVEVVIEDAADGRGWSGEYLEVMLLDSGLVTAAQMPRKSLQRLKIVRAEGRHLLGVLPKGHGR